MLKGDRGGAVAQSGDGNKIDVAGAGSLGTNGSVNLHNNTNIDIDAPDNAPVIVYATQDGFTYP